MKAETVRVITFAYPSEWIRPDTTPSPSTFASLASLFQGLAGSSNVATLPAPRTMPEPRCKLCCAVEFQKSQPMEGGTV